MPKKKKTATEPVIPEAKPVPEPTAAGASGAATAAVPAIEPVPAAKPAFVADAPVVVASDISLDASANAPFIYFENAGVSGLMNGMIRVTLEAGRILPGENNKVFVDRVIVGHLRMSIPAAQSLRNAVDRALLMASKPASREMN